MHNDLLTPSEWDSLLARVHDSLEKTALPDRRGSKSIASGASAHTLGSDISMPNLLNVDSPENLPSVNPVTKYPIVRAQHHLNFLRRVKTNLRVIINLCPQA
jgi:hypothetical protein